MKQSQDGTYRSSLLSTIPLSHGFTTKKHGDMSKSATVFNFFDSMHIATDRITMQKQIHGSIVHVVGEGDIGTDSIPSDGLVYQKNAGRKQAMLVVRVGDCIPILVVDPIQSIIGVAHSGWKGTMEHISKKMIETFVSLGSHAENIIVLIGPAICGHCYVVSEERARLFLENFPTERDVVIKSNGNWYVDIEKATLCDLESAGIAKTNIDYDKTLCTLEHPDLFYSFRRKSEPFGEIMGYIGYRG